MVFFTTGLMQCIQKVAGNVSEPMMLIFVIPLQCPRSSVPMKTINVHQRTVQNHLVFSAGFPTSDIRGSIFLGGRVSGAEICVLFWGGSLATSDLDPFFLKGYWGFFHGSGYQQLW